MVQQDEPGDYVLATGEAHSVREFLEKAFRFVGRRILWEGAGAQEKGRDIETGNVVVEVSPEYFRPTEVDSLVGDPTLAKERLGWQPRTTFTELVHEMMEEDLRRCRRRMIESDYD